jgi:rod shape-determining protein MreD
MAVVLIVTLLLRTTWLPWLGHHGLWLDAVALATVLWALRQGPAWGATFGFLLGLAADLDAGFQLGRHALSLTLLGWGAGVLSTTLVRDSWRTQLALAGAATLLHQAFALALEPGEGPASAWLWGQRVALSALLTAVAAVVLLGLLRLVVGRPLFNDLPFDAERVR